MQAVSDEQLIEWVAYGDPSCLGTFKAWLFNIARNSTLDSFRNNKRHKNMAPLDDYTESLLVDSHSAEQNTSGAQNIKILEKARAMQQLNVAFAESVNEDITVSFSGISADQAMSFTSVIGTLNLGLPANTGAELHIDSAEGEIVSDFEVDVQPSKPIISREDGRRGVEVKVESVIVAKINGGGTVIKLKTLNGNINITKSGT